MGWKAKVKERLEAEHRAGASWRDLGRRYDENQGKLWFIAKGKRDPSRSLARKMGIGFRKRYVVAFHCDTLEQQHKLQAIFGNYGTRVELRDGLLAGTIWLESDKEIESVVSTQILRWD